MCKDLKEDLQLCYFFVEKKSETLDWFLKSQK
jgi:hypothetical protein